jgi:hypothetical protein
VPLARVDDVHVELARRFEHLTVAWGSASLARPSLPHSKQSQVPLQTCFLAHDVSDNRAGASPDGLDGLPDELQVVSHSVNIAAWRTEVHLRRGSIMCLMTELTSKVFIRLAPVSATKVTNEPYDVHA